MSGCSVASGVTSEDFSDSSHMFKNPLDAPKTAACEYGCLQRAGRFQIVDYRGGDGRWRICGEKPRWVEGDGGKPYSQCG
jgi:hypothetical protein